MGKILLRKIDVKKLSHSDITNQQIANLKKAMEERKSAASWNKKDALQVGDSIYGIVLSKKKIKSKIGKKETETNYIQLKTNEGIKGVWLKTVLEKQFEELEIKLGDVVGIEYLGKVKNYENYNSAKLS